MKTKLYRPEYITYKTRVYSQSIEIDHIELKRPCDSSYWRKRLKEQQLGNTDIIREKSEELHIILTKICIYTELTKDLMSKVHKKVHVE